MQQTISLAWTVWFVLCLVPYSLAGGLSANYLFVLTPLALITLGYQVRHAPDLLYALIAWCTLVFVAALLYQLDFVRFGDRRLISFLLFLTPITWAFFDFPGKITRSFLAAIVAVSVYLSGASLWTAMQSGIIDPATLKAIIGSQRVGFLYLIAFWLLVGVMRSESFNKMLKLCSVGLALVVFAGMIATFSRSTYIAFIAGPCLFALSRGVKTRLRWRDVKAAGWMVGSLLVLGFATWYSYPPFFAFLDARILGLLSTDGLASLGNPEASEGARVVIWSMASDFVLRNPVTGSGFLGTWVLGEFSGSAHNEYVDRLLRIGIFGFTIYIAVIWRVWKNLSLNNPFLAVGFASVSVYGLFHETWSQSHGAAVFALFLAMWSQNWRSSRRMIGDRKGFFTEFSAVNQYPPPTVIPR